MVWLVGILALSNGGLTLLVIAWICWTARNTTGPIVSRFRIQFFLLTPFLVFAVIDARCLLLRIPVDPVFTFPQFAVHAVIWLVVLHLARSLRLGQQVGSLVELGRHDDAIELLRRRIAARSTPDASLINHLGIVYLQSGRIPEAVDELRQTVKLAPGVAIYRCNLALALHRRGDSEEAIQLIEQASANDVTNAGLYNDNRCIVLAESGRIEEARQLVSAAEEYAARTPLRSPLARRLREEAMARIQQTCGRPTSADQPS